MTASSAAESGESGREVRLPAPCLVVLVGPSGSGKSAWAAAQFRPSQVVSSDAMRGLVGEGEHDQRAGNDAFDVLDLVLERRLRRGLVTVVDSLGSDTKRRQRWIALAARHGVACHAVVFDTPADVCRARNRSRPRPVPAKVLTAQLQAWPATRAVLADDGFAAIHEPGVVRIVPRPHLDAPLLAARQKEDPMSLRFGLQIPNFTWEGGPAELAERLTQIAEAAEEAGFTSLWVMDHFLQIPQVGREWQDMLDSYTTLSFLAARTRTVRLGTLVTGVTYRNVAHLGKIVATLDVLSGGRAICGIGAAWFEREHKVYGWEFPPLRERYALLEDALEVLPLLWGPGAPRFEGRAITVPVAICYPRPLQERVPIMIGGSGERKTLRLVAQYADACNVFGDAETIRHKLDVLDRHCADIGRAREEIRVTSLSTVLVGRDRDEVTYEVDRLRAEVPPEAFATRTNAGTVEDHVGRFRGLAEAGLQTAIVNMANLSPAAVETFAEVIAAFPPPDDKSWPPF
jgi:F420-dependent oxidoreductase-like protein